MNREANIQRLKGESFDMLIIGGGATGTGVALDAASRGLKVGLVERDDFSSGTSSRSTKLIHGGVRYLEQAIKKFDRSQFNLVRDALKERKTLIKIAPHLAKPIPLLTPLYNVLEVPYFMTGLKLYEWLAGKANLDHSSFINADEAKERFPMLKREGLRGAVVYYDGQFDDARMNVAIALTAYEQGAVVANHVEVCDLLKDNGNISGVMLKDKLSNDKWVVSAKVVINATGPFTDTIRLMDDPNAVRMLSTSSGIHIILGKQFSPQATGLLIPETEDGRVLFLLPWLGCTLVGTTDNPAPLEDNPKATEDDISYVLRHVDKYFDIPVSREDVLASWSGLRPLVSDPKASDTASLSRDHVVNISDSGLFTIAGGKWTTYRKMALDAVDEAMKLAELSSEQSSQTEDLLLVGGENYDPEGGKALEKSHHLDHDIAGYLNRAYGSRALAIAELAANGHGERLSQNHPYTEAEVIYVAKEESARTVIDVLARRTRLGFLDQAETLKAMPKVAKLMAETLDWEEARKNQELENAKAYFS